MVFFRRYLPASGLFLLSFFLISCFESGGGKSGPAVSNISAAAGSDSENTGGDIEFTARLSAAMLGAELPGPLAENIRNASLTDPAFIVDLLIVLDADRYLRELVDKKRPLQRAYVPADLVALEGGSYLAGRKGLMLRGAAAAALEEMAAAAREDGITLTASSAYRSFDYQEELYNRNVREMGRDAADRESARPGCSQHQTGLAVDFGSIDDSFAQTGAGLWMQANAPRFGWSLSYPDGYEEVTGYRWESWHYRYVGRDLAAFIGNYFDGIQHYALCFLHEWAQY
ncbi:MAG: M15 family metallopeptidase [Treponema sp.]|nr:M15 family metallopeptidase [Treponema sp.]